MLLESTSAQIGSKFSRFKASFEDTFPAIFYFYGDIELMLGLKSWYKDPPIDYIIFSNSDREDVCPMRGSKKGIASREGSGRVNAYSYRMMYLLGVKIGRYFKNSSKRMIVIKRKKASNFMEVGQIGRIAINQFNKGVSFGYAPEGNKKELDIDAYHHIRSGMIVFMNMEGLSKTERDVVWDLRWEHIKSD